LSGILGHLCLFFGLHRPLKAAFAVIVRVEPPRMIDAPSTNSRRAFWTAKNTPFTLTQNSWSNCPSHCARSSSSRSGSDCFLAKRFSQQTQGVRMI